MIWSRRRTRFVLAALVLISSVGLLVLNAGAATHETVRTGSTYDREAITSAPGLTVVTDHYDDGRGAISAYSLDGELVYRNSTYGRYFDVDPVSERPPIVTYVGSRILDKGRCKIPSRRDLSCVRNVVERLNLATGETERIYTYDLATVHGPDSVHDVDRINASHYLVADIFENRAFIVNASSGLITWSWRAETDFSYRSGGPIVDWTHVNDVEYIERRDLVMVDLRNHDQVVFIDPRDGLQPELTLGADDDHDVLYEQHNPDYIPEEAGGPAIVVADSENNRIVEYQRVDGRWTESWTWQDERIEWPRDADRLPDGNTLVADTHSDRVFEVNPNGEIEWSIRHREPYEAERLGIGDESAGGRSASRLDLTSRTGADPPDVTSNGGRSVRSTIYGLVRGLIPNKLFHGLLWVLPSWVGLYDLILVAVLAVSTVSLVVTELLRQELVEFRSPISIRRE